MPASVSGNPVENAKYIRDFMRQGRRGGGAPAAHLRSLPVGYAGIDFRSFDKYDWDALA